MAYTSDRGSNSAVSDIDELRRQQTLAMRNLATVSAVQGKPVSSATTSGAVASPATYSPSYQSYSPPAATNYYAEAIAQMQAAQDAAQRRAEELAAKKQAAAQAAYDKNMGYLTDDYASRGNLLKNSYDDTLAQLQKSYESGTGTVNKNADSAQQQAYVNYMLSKRDMPQQLVALGISGGAAESNLADMYNSYGDTRNKTDLTRAENLAKLLESLDSNKSNALQTYNKQLSSDDAQRLAYKIQLEQALANGTSEILQGKYDTLQKLDDTYSQQMNALRTAQAEAAAKAASRTYTVSNKISGASKTQAASDTKSKTDITKLPMYKAAFNLVENGGGAKDVYDSLQNNKIPDETIDEILAALGL